NNADDNFNERMIDVLQIAANAHKVFLLSTNEKKRRLINLVLSTVKLNGRKLEYTLRSPFDMFVKLPENEEWRALEDSNL
ncbi:MAG TPA: recombinase RecB, partial [Candidatus Megaira endosymbiont of Mesostigma viride]|nr:recombinase RecB [Candidatus Megaira endosymbiont of Mesostigma viride]